MTTVGAEQSILIVDDDVGAIQLIRSTLSTYTNVRFATNGRDALRLAHERTPDLILLDGEMPGESGFEVCTKLKQDELLRDVPVIFVTAHDDLRFETRALELGAADFIAKPLSAPRVRLRVKLHLQLKRQLDELRALAMVDGLTRVRNRRAFDEALTREWRRARRTGRPLSLLLLDVDFFKAFNDTYGHLAGDECLQRVASLLALGARRPADLAARFGGEEFALLLAETDAEGAKHVGRRLVEAVAGAALPHRTSPVAAHITVSVGVCCHSAEPAQHEQPRPSQISERDLLETADRALYLAKSRGRNRVEYLEIEPQQPGGGRPESV